ncbi:MAG: UDP-N-acetylmuramoyl-L-alanine--D-glutamate ligase [Patescibacteria group bacterium]
MKNKLNTAVLGFGLEGKDAAEYLVNKGHNVTIFDQKSVQELDVDIYKNDNVKFICGPNYLKHNLSDYDVIVRSPGIYRFLPELLKIDNEKNSLTSNIKLFFDLCPCKIIGVTGTKGKGTTSTLIYEILKADKFDVYLGGNIGKPALGLLSKLTKNSVVILEMSSFQLIDLHKSPNIAVVLNVTSDHMDWHKDISEYLSAKKNILRHQSETDFSIINEDYEISKGFAKETESQTYFFSSNNKATGCYIDGEKIILTIEEEKVIGKVKDLLLRGKHNWENVNAAICASYLAGANISTIRKVIFGFKGLEHRLELVGQYKEISFYNDSFSTNPQTTIAAIKSFKEKMVIILGGSDKQLDYAQMAKEIVAAKNVETVILIGQIADQIQRELINKSFKGKMINLGMTTMQEIFKTSMKLANPGSVVILSPATASFGMFIDYKDRGNQFKEAVKSLIQ